MNVPRNLNVVRLLDSRLTKMDGHALASAVVHASVARVILWFARAPRPIRTGEVPRTAVVMMLRRVGPGNVAFEGLNGMRLVGDDPLD